MDSKFPKQEKRKFLGKTKDFKNNQERHFYQRMLKAYLKGHEFFHFGKDNKGLPKLQEVLFSPKRTEKQVEEILQKGFNIAGKVFGGVKIGKSQLRKKIRNRIEDKINAEKEQQKKSPKTLAQKLGLKK